MTAFQTAAPVSGSGGTFVPAEVFAGLSSLDRARADSMPFGIVQVDDGGRILLYNRYESDLAGIAPTSAEGRNFFTQVAPCTNNGLFFGTFKKGVAAGQLNVTFPYTFTYRMKPTNVRVHLYRDGASSTNWIFVSRA